MLDLIYPASGRTPLPNGCRMERASEMLPLVDNEGYVYGQAPRNWCHGGSFVMHPVVHLHIINRSSCIYLQKRSASKQLFPSRWDTAVGGHVTFGEYIKEALYREAAEELSLVDFNPYWITTYEFTSGTEKELVSVFAAVGDFQLSPSNDEVEQGRYWSIGEIEENLGKDVFTPNFESEFAMIGSKLLALL